MNRGNLVVLSWNHISDVFLLFLLYLRILLPLLIASFVLLRRHTYLLLYFLQLTFDALNLPQQQLLHLGLAVTFA